MVVASDICPLRALSNTEKTHIEECLRDITTSTILSLALVSLRTTDIFEGALTTGTLALASGKEPNGDRSSSLIFYDLDGDNCSWFHALSAQSKLEWTDSSTSKYFLTDPDLNGPVEIIFGDVQEAFGLLKSVLSICRRLENRIIKTNTRSFRASRVPRWLDGVDISVSEEPVSIPVEAHYFSSCPTLHEFQSRSNCGPKTTPEDEQTCSRRHYSAPAAVEASYLNERVRSFQTNEDPRISRYCTIDGWRERARASDIETNLFAPTLSSAPPRIVIKRASNESVDTKKEGQRHWPSSSPCPPCTTSSSTSSISGATLSPGPSVSTSRSPISRKSLRKMKRFDIADNDYEIEDVTDDISDIAIGLINRNGGFGTVRRAKCRGQPIALKQLNPSREQYLNTDYYASDKMVYSKRYYKEAVMTMKCSDLCHPNIVKFIGVAASEELGACLVLPWMQNGDSLDYVTKEKPPRLPIIHGALKGLEYMHCKGFVHGDLKANVLIDDEGNPRLSDFGLASCSELDVVENSRSIQKAGNAQWKAIELLLNGDSDISGKLTKMSDMWAFAMFAIEILTGNLPFPNRREASIIIAVFHDKRPSRPVHPECSDTLWSVMEGCWKKAPGERLTAKQALEHVEKGVSSS